METIHHADKAAELFLSGYNCAQSVMGAFCDVTGMDFDTAMRLSSSFGGGMGRMREVCGTVSSMLMIAGILWSYGGTGEGGEKAAHYTRVQHLAAEFKEVHHTIICRELIAGLKKDTSPIPDPRTAQYYKERPCVRFVRTAAEILDREIALEQEAKIAGEQE